MCSDLRDYLLFINFFSHQQHGFRKGYSFIDNWLAAIDRWIKILDDRGRFDVMYLEFSKVFDRINHICPMNELKRLGITLYLVDWLSLYLTEARVKFTSSGCGMSCWGLPELCARTALFLELFHSRHRHIYYFLLLL